MSLTALKKRAERLAGAYEHAKQQVREEAGRLEGIKTSLAHTEEAQALIQHTAQHIQQQVHKQIAAVVSDCLGAVFMEDAYSFAIEFEKKRGKTEARLSFLREGHEVDPITASGGGPLDVAAFALRVICLRLHRPQLRQLLCLDEPFKNLSREYVPRAGGLLHKLSGEFGLQIVMVTHNPRLQVGRVITIE